MPPSAIEPREWLLDTGPPRPRHFWSRDYLLRFALDGTGIRCDYAYLGSVQLRWDDPKLVFVLADYSAPILRNSRQLFGDAKKKPFQFWCRYYNISASIPEEAFRAVGAAAISAGLMTRLTSDSHVPEDTILTIYGRGNLSRWVAMGR